MKDILVRIRSTFEGSGLTQAASGAKTTRNEFAALRREAVAGLARGATVSAIGVAFTKAGDKMLQFASNAANASRTFEHSLAIVNTQARLSQSGIARFGDQLLKVAGTTAQPLDELTKSSYDLFSTIDIGGDRAVTGAKMIQQLAHAADAAGASMETTSRAVFTMLNAYGKIRPTVKDVNDILDLQFGLVRRAAGTFDEVSKAIGTVLPSARATGQSLQTVSGVLAFTTRQLGNVQQSATSVARAMDMFAKPDNAERLHEFGVEVFDTQGKFRSFTTIIEEFAKKVSALTDEQRTEVIARIFGRGDVRAMKFLKAAIPNIDKLKFAMKDAASQGEALANFQKVSATNMQRLAVATNAYQAELTRAGKAFDSVLAPAKQFGISLQTDVLKAFNALPRSMQAVVAGGVVVGGGFLKIVGSALKLAGALIALNALMRMSGMGTLTERLDVLKNKFGSLSGIVRGKLGAAFGMANDAVVSASTGMASAGVTAGVAAGGILAAAAAIWAGAKAGAAFGKTRIGAHIRDAVHLGSGHVADLDATARLIDTIGRGLSALGPDAQPALDAFNDLQARGKLTKEILDNLSDPTNLRAFNAAMKESGADAGDLFNRLASGVPITQALAHHLSSAFVNGLDESQIRAKSTALNGIAGQLGIIGDNAEETEKNIKQWRDSTSAAISDMDGFLSSLSGKFATMQHQGKNTSKSLLDALAVHRKQIITMRKDMDEALSKGIPPEFASTIANMGLEGDSLLKAFNEGSATERKNIIANLRQIKTESDRISGDMETSFGNTFAKQHKVNVAFVLNKKTLDVDIRFTPRPGEAPTYHPYNPTYGPFTGSAAGRPNSNQRIGSAKGPGAKNGAIIRAATGMYIDGPTEVLVGEEPGNPEVIIPLGPRHKKDRERLMAATGLGKPAFASGGIISRGALPHLASGGRVIGSSTVSGGHTLNPEKTTALREALTEIKVLDRALNRLAIVMRQISKASPIVQINSMAGAMTTLSKKAEEFAARTKNAVENHLLPKSMETRAQAYANAAANLTARLNSVKEQMNQFGESVKQGFAGMQDVSQLDFSGVTGGDVNRVLAANAEKSKEFSGVLNDLANKGLDKGLIQQLAAKGPESINLAKAYGSSNIKETNKNYRAISATAKQTAATLENKLFGQQVSALRTQVKAFSDGLAALVSATNKALPQMVALSTGTKRGAARNKGHGGGGRGKHKGRWHYDDSGEYVFGATGMIATRPTKVIMGEAGHEALIPLNAHGANFARQALRANSTMQNVAVHHHYHVQTVVQDAKQIVSELEWAMRNVGV